MDGRGECGWVKLYHPKGVLVTLPLGRGVDFGAALGEVSAALAAGWLVEAPGLEAGEQQERVGWVVKREKEQDGGKRITPMIDLYPADEGKKYSVLTVYLNTAEDVAAFERASGLVVGQLPVYIGANKIERGASRQTDKLVTRARPFGVVHKPNPKYNPDEKDATKKKPARLFVRWLDDGPAPARADQPGTVTLPAGAGQPQVLSAADQELLVGGWLEGLAKDPTRAEFNQQLPNLARLTDGRKTQMWEALKSHAHKCGWMWDKETKAFEQGCDAF